MERRFRRSRNVSGKCAAFTIVGKNVVGRN